MWLVFLDLDDTRRFDMGEPLAISYGEITDRGEALGFPLEPWEVQAIRRLDRLRRKHRSGGGSDGG